MPTNICFASFRCRLAIQRRSVVLRVVAAHVRAHGVFAIVATVNEEPDCEKHQVDEQCQHQPERWPVV